MYLIDLLPRTKTPPKFRRFLYNDINPLSGTRKKRLIEAPNTSMRQLHKRLISHLRSLPADLRFATGARPGANPARHVARHRQNRYIYHLDLRDAYHTINLNTLAEILLSLEGQLPLNTEVEMARTFLENYCASCSGGLAVGAPASPDLFNIYASAVLDRVLAPVVARYGMTYTRYIDDLVFSAAEVIGEKKRSNIRSIIESAGFSISHRKTHVWDLMKGPVVVNGVGLELGGRIFVPQQFRWKTKKLLRKFLETGEGFSELSGRMGVISGIMREEPFDQTFTRLVHTYRVARKAARRRKKQKG